MNSESKPNDRDYFPVDSFQLNRDFLKNPLMATIKLARYKFTAKMLSPTDKVLDLGCGSGLSSYYYSFYASEVLGVDLYADIDQAKDLYKKENLAFAQEDILSLPESIKNYKATAITMVDVIEHFYRKDGEKIIRNCSEMLQDGGMMILGTPSKYSEAYRAKSNHHIHFHEYEPQELRDLCGQHFSRTLMFSMNDEVVHTGFDKLAWFFYVLCFK